MTAVLTISLAFTKFQHVPNNTAIYFQHKAPYNMSLFLSYKTAKDALKHSSHNHDFSNPIFQLCHKENFREHLKTSSDFLDALCAHKTQPGTVSQSQCVSAALFYIKVFHQSVSLISENMLVCMCEHRHDFKQI